MSEWCKFLLLEVFPRRDPSSPIHAGDRVRGLRSTPNPTHLGLNRMAPKKACDDPGEYPKP